MWKSLKQIKYLLILLLLTFLSSKITQKDGRFIDEFGRTKIFHGVNIVYKLPPYIPTTDKFDPYLSFTEEEDLVYMKKFGFNLVRLGVMWEALEKAPGVYDYELLEKYYNLVLLLGQNGIYTMIDAHQDLLTRRFCGEGIPDFYIKTLDYEKTCKYSWLGMIAHLVGACKGMNEYGHRVDDRGMPLLEDCKKRMFAVYNSSPDITSVYEKLFNNEGGLLDKFIKFWQVVAEKFKGNEFVIGYDIWNEPFPGGLYKHLVSAITPGRADNEQLLPFYRKVDEAIRQVDPDYTLMFERFPFPDFLPIWFLQFRGIFKEAPLGGALENKQVFNYHSYCCGMGFDMCAKGEPQLENYKKCRDFHFETVEEATVYAKKHNMGTIISEFGACFNSQNCYNEISSLADAADKALTSWAYWMFKPYEDFTTSCPDNKEGLWNEDGSLQEFKIKALTRTYAQSVQGEIKEMNFDKDSKTFTLKFILDGGIRQPTEIYINKDLNYESGYKVVTSRKTLVVDETDGSILKVLFEPQDVSEGNGDNGEVSIVVLKTQKKLI